MPHFVGKPPKKAVSQWLDVRERELPARPEYARLDVAVCEEGLKTERICLVHEMLVGMRFSPSKLWLLLPEAEDFDA